MEEDDISFVEAPGDNPQVTYEKQLEALQLYLKSLPYECETPEQMQRALESIVGKIYIAVKAKNWAALGAWDYIFQCWLILSYPISKSTRAKLAKLYYELSILPGIEVRKLRTWADMFSRLISSKSGAWVYNKLGPEELQLDWKPIWRSLKKEIWPKTAIADPHRNLVNILLYVAFHARRFYPADVVPEMLETFLPMLTQSNMLNMIPIITSFLPSTNSDLYLPPLFKIWEAFNSSVADDRLLELCGNLSEEHVAGRAGDHGDLAPEWKDVGIWSQWEWDFLTGKALGSMNVPIGMMKNSGSNTSQHADVSDGGKSKIKKSVNRMHCISRLFVYSMRVDGEIRQDTPAGAGRGSVSKQTGFAGGSKALDTLEKFIHSTETFFHPSNLGSWTPNLTLLLQRLASDFMTRTKEEEMPTCKVPESQRLSPQIRRSFVKLLSTPALLGMFSKDPTSASLAQGALRLLSLLEPSLIMPELLERAYGGLEVVNETHRTTAVLSTLASITRPLLTEKIWLGGQKHLLPLLELCLPGIDLNDPVKTICATMFISDAVKNIVIGDLSASHGVSSYDDGMDVDSEVDHMPDGTEPGDGIVLSREDERSLVRDSSASFADWVLTLFRRVFALYENLPEEGGRKNTTGGKSEEAVLKSIKVMLDLIAQQLSEPLFDMVLKLVYNYGTTNAKSNAVRAFGQLIGSLAKANPEKTMSKFLPFCVAQIEDELKHGASSVRTTSTHAAVASDTTLHWNLSILRGCLGYGGASIVKHRETIISLLVTLVEKTKSERGYTSTGRLITRILDALHSTYALDARLVNSDEWKDPKFMSSHNLHWGKMYDPKDVVVDWHYASPEDVDFILEVLDRIQKPALDLVDNLLERTASWDSVARNDFCRYLHAARSVWMGLSTFVKLPPMKQSANPLLIEAFEMPEMLVSSLDVSCGFTLSDPADPRYQKALAYRTRYGEVIARAASLLRQNTGGEDHADALMTVTRSVDTYLLSYCSNRGDFDSLQKNYRTSRDASRTWPRQKENFRSVAVQRASLYHMGRVHMHTMYRARSELDDKLLLELTELSLSPYTRIRRQAQHTLHVATLHFLRSTKLVLPVLYKALEKGTDPDRMKGALYVLWVKGIAGFALGDHELQQPFLVSLLECQHEDKPSIQKIVNNISNDCLSQLSEDSFSQDSYNCDTSRLNAVLDDLEAEFSDNFVDRRLLDQFIAKTQIRHQDTDAVYHKSVSAVLEIATRPTTHWRYVQLASKILNNLIRRDVPMPPEVGKFFAEQTLSPQPTIRGLAQRAVTRLLYLVKARTHSSSVDALWQQEWRHPSKESITVSDPAAFLQQLQDPVSESGYFVDKIDTGFISWTKTIDVYRAAPQPSLEWEANSKPLLDAIYEVVNREDYFKQVSSLWGQEPTKGSGTLSLRGEHIRIIKYFAVLFGHGGDWTTRMLEETSTLIADSDKFKQRAGADIISGILRGSKHWGEDALGNVWSWFGGRLDLIFSQIKPDTTNFWQCLFHEQLSGRDPRRNKVIVDWILGFQLEFTGESAFQMAKSMTLFSMLVDGLGIFFNPYSSKYIELFFANANTDYAEIRLHLCHNLYAMMRHLWQPSYPTTHAFLVACREAKDPMQIRQAMYLKYVNEVAQQFPKWREERLPPPRVNQSQYDKVALSILQWIWISAHGPSAHLIIPYIVPLMPEILRMSELNDNPEVQAYSSGALYILSALTPLSDFVEPTLDKFVESIDSSKSWKTQLHGLPALVIFFYRNLLSLDPEQVSKVMRVLLDCLSNENVEVREMACKVLSGVVRTSQRQNIIPLKNRFITLAKKTNLPSRRDPEYAATLRTLHSAVLGLCSLVESFPYSVEPWLPPLTEVLAAHATDPPPISTTIRNCASEFKKTHQDTWHKDQLLFDEDQLQSLSTMLVGTSYYA